MFIGQGLGRDSLVSMGIQALGIGLGSSTRTEVRVQGYRVTGLQGLGLRV